MKAPFPYFGGKSRVADVVWQRFGDVPNYVEPFCGSAAALLARPSTHTGRIETINDFDGYVANFWRAMAHAPEDVAKHADWPVNEIDLTARHKYLARFRDEFTSAMREDPNLYDPKVAGWWVWGICSWIGHGFAVNPNRSQIPHLAGGGQGINRAGGVWAQLEDVATRMRRVRVACGDWQRVCTPAVSTGIGLTGVFLDPPYPEGSYSYGEGTDREVAHDVRDWCIENGNNPLLRIALCGYDEHKDMEKHGWVPYAWKATGGYGNQGQGSGRDNAEREIIWFSPHCLNPEDPDKFEEFFFG